MAKKTPAKTAAPKIRDTWNLGLMYLSPGDPKIERDLKAMEKACAEFEKKWRPQVKKLGQPKALAEAMRDYESLVEALASNRAGFFLGLSRALDSESQELRAAESRASQRAVSAGNRVEFFTLAIGKLAAAEQARALKAKELAPYRYYLSRVFLTARYQLPEVAETLSNSLSLPGKAMWMDMTDARENALTVEKDGKHVPIAEALGAVSSTADAAERRALHSRSIAALKTVAHYAEAEINAVYTWKKAQDEARGFARPEDATLLSYEVDAKTVAALRKAVTDAYPLARRFYAAKAKLLGLKKLTYADRGVGLAGGTAEGWKPSFAEAADSFKEILDGVGPWYRETFDRYLRDGHLDAYPKKGKTGGAFCTSIRKSPIYVLLNHEPSSRSFATLAHEMGHAFHSEHAGAQAAIYEGYSMATAESASTFFERLAFEKMVAEAPSEESRFGLVFQKANDFVATVFRQIACSEFELALHRRIRAEGYLSAAEIGKEHNRAMSAYLGDAVELSDDDGYFFVTWSHIRRHFYVFSYAFGELVANALYEKYEKEGDVAAFEKFMKAGGSDTVESIFGASGLDVTKPAFWKKGLAAFERMVEEIEAAAARKGKR
jgi:oligoendopeptidase F